MARVSLKNVTKRFGKVVAVDRLSLDVEDNELFVIVGPNGCGKTTVLKLIAGLIKPDEGEIYIDGKNVTNLPPAKRNVRMVFQNYALYPHMRVYEEEGYSNLTFALKIRKFLKENIVNRIEMVSRKIGITEDLYERYPNELSSGQQQKVAVGRAIALPPKIFLLDEPLAHLDPPTRLKVREEIKILHKDLRATTIYVTNELPEAFAMADRMAIMREGRIEQIGRAQDIYENPASNFVSDFIKTYNLLYRL
ncbi:MAG: ABC transporter ATP-binding protein [Nitrososphaeria archaeon]|nr:ABC transporter ATP-binding protein [Nitrososphaeria archaeon]